jgi:hypothetical protein
MNSSNLVVKVKLRDATKSCVAVAKANHSEVDSEDIDGANVDKKMTAKVPKKKSVSNVDKRLMMKALKKNSGPRMKSALSKKRDEDLAKQVTKRNTQKTTVMSRTVAPEPDKLVTALLPVQSDNEGTAMKSIMNHPIKLRKCREMKKIHLSTVMMLMQQLWKCHLMSHPITLRKCREMMMTLVTLNKKIKLRMCRVLFSP